MKYAYLALNWILGIFFLVPGVMALVYSPLGGLCLIGAAFLLLPPVRQFAYTKIKREMPENIRAISVLVLLFSFGIFANQALVRRQEQAAAQQARENAARFAELRQERIDYFRANRVQIIESVKSALSNKKYETAVARTRKYLIADDAELERLNTQAKQALAAARTAEKTEQLLARLEDIPVEQYEKNLELYQELKNMHPNSDRYKEKVAFYSAKITKKKKRIRAAKKRKEKIEAQFSAWDGSHINLERLIKRSMNNPDSYDHVKTIYWDRGDFLVVRTTFRGTNVFGGVVTNSVTAKVSLDGQVIEVISQN